MARKRVFEMTVDRARDLVFEQWNASKESEQSDEVHRAVARFVSLLTERLDSLSPPEE